MVILQDKDSMKNLYILFVLSVQTITSHHKSVGSVKDQFFKSGIGHELWYERNDFWKNNSYYLCSADTTDKCNGHKYIERALSLVLFTNNSVVAAPPPPVESCRQWTMDQDMGSCTGRRGKASGWGDAG